MPLMSRVKFKVAIDQFKKGEIAWVPDFLIKSKYAGKVEEVSPYDDLEDEPKPRAKKATK